MSSWVYILVPFALGIILAASTAGFCCYVRYKKRITVKEIRKKYILTKIGALEGPGWSETSKKKRKLFFKKKDKPRFTGYYGDDKEFDPTMQHRFEQDLDDCHGQYSNYQDYHPDIRDNLEPAINGSILSDHNEIYYRDTNAYDPHRFPANNDRFVNEYINQDPPRSAYQNRNNRDRNRYQTSDGGFSGSEQGSQSRRNLVSPPMYINDQRNEGSMISERSYVRQDPSQNFPRNGYF